MRRWLLVIALLALVAWESGNSGVNQEAFHSYSVCQRLDPSSGDHPGTAPTKTDLTVQVAWCFDDDGEKQYYITPVPSDWDSASDMQLYIGWTNELTDALADGETVKWNVSWYVINPAAVMTYDNGTPVAATTTYTQFGAGTDKDIHATPITIDWDHGDQTLAANWFLHFTLTRHKTGDTYAGDACMVALKWCRDINKLPNLF